MQKLDRQLFIPKNAVEIKSADCSAVAYLETGVAKILAKGFSGKRGLARISG